MTEHAQSRRGFLCSMFAAAAVATGLSRTRLELVDDEPERAAMPILHAYQRERDGVMFWVDEWEDIRRAVEYFRAGYPFA